MRTSLTHRRLMVGGAAAAVLGALGDGLGVRAIGESDHVGYGDETTTPHRARAKSAVETLASSFADRTDA